MLWDLKKDVEIKSYTSQEGDVFVGHIHGDENNEFGFLMFNTYLLDLKEMLPNPFF